MNNNKNIVALVYLDIIEHPKIFFEYKLHGLFLNNLLTLFKSQLLFQERDKINPFALRFFFFMYHKILNLLERLKKFNRL